MANTSKKNTVETAAIYDETKAVEVKSEKVKEPYNGIWTLVENSDFNTYVLNLKNGCIVKTESENGVAMSYVPNIRFSETSFERIV